MCVYPVSHLPGLWLIVLEKPDQNRSYLFGMKGWNLNWPICGWNWKKKKVNRWKCLSVGWNTCVKRSQNKYINKRLLYLHLLPQFWITVFSEPQQSWVLKHLHFFHFVLNISPCCLELAQAVTSFLSLMNLAQGILFQWLWSEPLCCVAKHVFLLCFSTFFILLFHS